MDGAKIQKVSVPVKEQKLFAVSTYFGERLYEQKSKEY
jgi:hypothetical protein